MNVILMSVLRVLVWVLVGELRAILASRREKNRIRRTEQEKIQKEQEHVRAELETRLAERKRATRRDTVRRLRG